MPPTTCNKIKYDKKLNAGQSKVDNQIAHSGSKTIADCAKILSFLTFVWGNFYLQNNTTFSNTKIERL